MSSVPNGAQTLRRVAADGSGPLGDLGLGREHSVSADGRFVFYARDFDLFYRPVEGGEETAFLKTPLREHSPRLSPDGRFVLFVQRDSKTLATLAHLKPFPSGEPQVPLGFMVHGFKWSADGKKIYYIWQADVFEVDVETTPRVRAGVPRKLFSLRSLGTSEFFPSFDVTADGQRFLTLVSDPAATVQRVVVMTGFTPRN